MRSLSAIFASLVALAGAPLVATVAFLPTVAGASTSIELSMSELVSGATLVVAGTPLESRSLWEGDASSHGRRIVTYTRVRVDRMLDGSPRQEVWIRTLGGEVDDIGQQVAGEAVLRVAEPALLFLRDRADGTHLVVGMSQGQYMLDARPEIATARVRAPREGTQLVPRVGLVGAAPLSARSALMGRTLDEVESLVAAQRRAHAP